MDPPTYPFEETSFMDGPQLNFDKTNLKTSFLPLSLEIQICVCNYKKTDIGIPSKL
jgi:hypothetical protein